VSNFAILKVMKESKRISTGGGEIEFILRPNRRVSALRLSVYPDGRVAVSAPARLSVSSIEAFVKNKTDWIVDKINHFKKFTGRTVLRGGRREYLKHKEIARTLAHERLAHFNKFYQFNYRAVAIRDQKSRWGSCSKQGNLNFSYKIARIDPDLADYIIVHELCHLKEFNHSKRFWDLVAQTVPNYKALRKRLKDGKLLV
jgi:hypothetical protein